MWLWKPAWSRSHIFHSEGRCRALGIGHQPRFLLLWCVWGGSGAQGPPLLRGSSPWAFLNSGPSTYLAGFSCRLPMTSELEVLIDTCVPVHPHVSLLWFTCSFFPLADLKWLRLNTRCTINSCSTSSHNCVGFVSYWFCFSQWTTC